MESEGGDAEGVDGGVSGGASGVGGSGGGAERRGVILSLGRAPDRSFRYLNGLTLLDTCKYPNGITHLDTFPKKDWTKIMRR